jgi:hypothetical protein
MPNERLSRGDAMPLTTGGDWSVGLNSRTSIGQAHLLQLLGRRLRADYKQVVEEPLPDALKSLLQHLDDKETDPEE